MLAHYRLADREPHPRSLAWLLGRKERRKQPSLVLRSDARAGILERDHRARSVALMFLNSDHSQRAAAALHRVERVHDHVDEHLLDLVGVALYRQRIYAELCDYLHVAM